MIIHTSPLHHRILPSCTKSSTTAAQFRPKCDLFRRHKNNDAAFQYLRMTGAQDSLLSPFAVGSNVSENTDDMFDDVFEKHGKVVFKRNDQKAVIAEVDDDAESLSFALAMAKVASDVKAGDIRLLFVKPLVYWTRFFIIATAFSRPQADAIGGRIRDLAETKYGRTATGDYKPNSWTLLDFAPSLGAETAGFEHTESSSKHKLKVLSPSSISAMSDGAGKQMPSVEFDKTSL